ncbi:MAG TPA: AAA domain-containing protein, partial [Pyrinomonadaceae bacterium]|nr:AAA domain-containing protein [Pyrinomonadaceae bacterium]
TPEAAAALPFLRGQLARQRGLSPLRTTFQRSYAAIRAIKPVFLMSPLTVAQLLDGQAPTFDLVIFDEASQLPAEDAVGAIVRGRQLVVVGDPKQLPPTNFFSVMSGTTNVPVGEDGVPLFEDSESILEDFMGSGAPWTRLKWHYRSAHESLINFSNVSFYDADLYTFPSVETDSQHTGLSFEYIPDGVYEGKGLNLVEARRVADAVVRHAQTRPEQSLGVGTFNLRQQIAIQDELEVRRRQDPSLEPFFARSKREPFFVKNLENIQGDERDVIFLSVTYAQDASGVLRYNFGPLNGENGWRRLNVLTTRARQSMRVFSSMKGDEINPVHATSQGPQLLRDFLLYAERGRLDSTTARAAADTESPFEREVYLELTRRGVQLQPQVGVAGYRIDFGVRDPELPGRYLCGIECDGAAYHSSETARDRDRLRQQVLEARGWTIHRLWSTDWFKDRNGQIERLLELIERTRQKEQAEQAAEREAEQEARARQAALEAEAAQQAQSAPQAATTSSIQAAPDEESTAAALLPQA